MRLRTILLTAAMALAPVLASAQTDPHFSAATIDSLSGDITPTTVTPTGGVPRNLPDALMDNRDARNFGAVCNGASNPLSNTYATLAAAQLKFPQATALTEETDLAAIIKEISVTGKAVLPPGECMINGPIAYSVSGTSIAGRGMGITTIHMELAPGQSAPSYYGVLMGQTYQTGTPVALTNLALSDLTLDGGWEANGTNLGLPYPATSANGGGIEVGPLSSHVRIERVEVKNQEGGAAIGVMGSAVEIRQNQVHDNWANGIYVSGNVVGTNPNQAIVYANHVRVDGNALWHNSLQNYPTANTSGGYGGAPSLILGTGGRFVFDPAGPNSNCTGHSFCVGGNDGIDFDPNVQDSEAIGNTIIGGDILAYDPGSTVNGATVTTGSSGLLIENNTVIASASNGVNLSGFQSGDQVIGNHFYKLIDKLNASTGTSLTLSQQLAAAHSGGCIMQSGDVLNATIMGNVCEGGSVFPDYSVFPPSFTDTTAQAQTANPVAIGAYSYDQTVNGTVYAPVGTMISGNTFRDMVDPNNPSKYSIIDFSNASGTSACGYTIKNNSFIEDRGLGTAPFAYSINLANACSGNMEATGNTPLAGSSGTVNSVSGQTVNPGGTTYITASTVVLKANNGSDFASPSATLTNLGGAALAGTQTFTGANTFSGASTFSGTTTISGNVTFNTGTNTFASATYGLDAYGMVQPMFNGTAINATKQVLGNILSSRTYAASIWAPPGYALCQDTTPTLLSSIYGTTTAGANYTPTGTNKGTADSQGNFARTVFTDLNAWASVIGQTSLPNPADAVDGDVILAALNWVAAHGGGTVQLPAGTCWENNTTVLAQNMTLNGAGEGATVVRGTSISGSTFSYVTYPIIKVGNYKNGAQTVNGSHSAVSNLTANGNGTWAPINAGAVPGVDPIYGTTNSTQATTSSPLTFPSTVTGVEYGMPLNGPGVTYGYKVSCAYGQNVVSAAVNAGGSGYVKGDVVTVQGGTFTTAAQFTVSAVSGGVVTGLSLDGTGGQYSAAPGSGATTSGGSGTGLTVNPTMGSLAPYCAVPLSIQPMNASGTIQPTTLLSATGAGYTFNTGWFLGFDPFQATTTAAQDTSGVRVYTSGTTAAHSSTINLVSGTGVVNGMIAGNAGLNVQGIPANDAVTISGNVLTLASQTTASIPSGTEIDLITSTSGAIYLSSLTSTGSNGQTLEAISGFAMFASNPNTGVPDNVPAAVFACNQDITGVSTANTNPDGSCIANPVFEYDTNGRLVVPGFPQYNNWTATQIPSGTTFYVSGMLPHAGVAGIMVAAGTSDVTLDHVKTVGVPGQGIFVQGSNVRVLNSYSTDAWQGGFNTYGDDNNGNGPLQMACHEFISGNYITRTAMFNHYRLNGPNGVETYLKWQGNGGARGSGDPLGYDGAGLNQEVCDLLFTGNKLFGNDIILSEPMQTPEQQVTGTTLPPAYFGGIRVTNNFVSSPINAITLSGDQQHVVIADNFLTGGLPTTGQVSACEYINGGLTDSDVLFEGNVCSGDQHAYGVYVIGGYGTLGGVTFRNNSFRDIGYASQGSGYTFIGSPKLGPHILIDGGIVCGSETGSSPLLYDIDTSLSGSPIEIDNVKGCANQAPIRVNLQTGTNADRLANLVMGGPVSMRPAAGSSNLLWADPSTGLIWMDNRDATWHLMLPGGLGSLSTQAIAATGTSCSAATPLVALDNEVTSGAGFVQLPAAAGAHVRVYNRSASAITVCPPTGGGIDANGVNTGVSVASMGVGQWDEMTSTVIYTMP